MSLVVIHGHTTVVFAAACLGKEGVGGHGSLHVESSFSQCVHGRDNLFLLLPAKETVVAGVWVQAGNAYLGLFKAKLPARIVYQFGHLYDAVFLHPVARLAQRHVGGYVYHPHKLVCQQHGVFLGACEVGINLGVPVKVMPSLVQCLLVEWCCHCTVHLARHGQFYGFDDRHEGGVPALRSHLSGLKGGHIHASQVINVDYSRFKERLAHRVYHVDSLTGAHLSHCPFHHGSIAGDQRTALLVGFGQVECLDDNLWSDASGVAHGDG